MSACPRQRGSPRGTRPTRGFAALFRKPLFGESGGGDENEAKQPSICCRIVLSSTLTHFHCTTLQLVSVPPFPFLLIYTSPHYIYPSHSHCILCKLASIEVFHVSQFSRISLLMPALQFSCRLQLSWCCRWGGFTLSSSPPPWPFWSLFTVMPSFSLSSLHGLWNRCCCLAHNSVCWRWVLVCGGLPVVLWICSWSGVC